MNARRGLCPGYFILSYDNGSLDFAEGYLPQDTTFEDLLDALNYNFFKEWNSSKNTQGAYFEEYRLFAVGAEYEYGLTITDATETDEKIIDFYKNEVKQNPLTIKYTFRFKKPENTISGMSLYVIEK